mgnify:CR=1 FL=1
MELFCFLRMGGSPDRVVVLPVLEEDEAALGPADSAQAIDRFKADVAKFDVAIARCAIEEDTQRLLSCIVRADHMMRLAARMPQPPSLPPPIHTAASLASHTKWLKRPQPYTPPLCRLALRDCPCLRDRRR